MMKLRVLDPTGEAAQPESKLAPRPTDLTGKVLWFVDGRGHVENSVPGMNRIFRVWKERLQKEYKLGDVRYVRTDNIASPFRHGKETFEEIVRTADVVVNGVAL
ncbi:MAG: hypothetical protein Q7T26_03875 [Dehalococcoidia bacterium]|nr:hypothetical protein [Dehalococcoidia bacterium]